MKNSRMSSAHLVSGLILYFVIISSTCFVIISDKMPEVRVPIYFPILFVKVVIILKIILVHETVYYYLCNVYSF